MITTQFYPFSNIQNVPSYNEITGTPSIDWTIGYFNSVTKKPLYTKAGFWQERFRSVTSELWMTGLSIPANTSTLVGIEFLLNVQRAARIQDLTIQLTLGGELIGNNYASVINPVQSDMYTGDFTTPLNPVGDYNIYGGPADMWGTTLTSTQVYDQTFGVVISFQSNVIYPHSDLAYLGQVGLRTTYA
jgi:hypothetical protein